MNRKILIIGDIHGRTNWKRIPNLDSYDQIIVMGDYFDPYGGGTSYDETWNNFQDLLKYQKDQPVGRVILLTGNHDHHYLGECGFRERGSRWDGYFKEAYQVEEVLRELIDKSKLKLAYHIPDTDILCVHAGVSIWWYNRAILNKPFDVAEAEAVISIKPHDSDAVAKLAREINQAPLTVFGFYDSPWDIYGYDRRQGPLWWRCMEKYGEGVQEENILQGFTQVMGHTQMRKLTEVVGKHADTRAVFVDLLGSDGYTVLTILDDKSYTFTEYPIH